MTHIANDSRSEATDRTDRAYRSELRTEQADATRERILDAAVRVMASGLATISIPAVAREAGVSVPTVYRHFGTKPALLAAVYPHLLRRARVSDVPVPASLDDLRPGVKALFGRLDAFDDLARAAMASPASEEARRLNMPDRFRQTKRLADTVEPPLAET